MDDRQIPARALALIALLQGLALLLLHQSIAGEVWPRGEPSWLYCLYTIAFVGPTMLLLGLERERVRAVLGGAALFTLVAAALGYYVGAQVAPAPAAGTGSLLFALVATLGIASFKALMYVQQLARGGAPSYSGLFRDSWRNFLTLALALLFTLCVWGVLMLWAGLFSAIGIGFFRQLFGEPWFYYPALALANGLGIALFRHQRTIIDTIAQILRALMKFLLLLLALMSMLFLAALPFTGLQPLWDSGGSFLILCLQALLLFFVNAVYQDDPAARPYPLWLHRCIWLSVALLPVYSAISCYGLSLRVIQYGWTLDRCWAFLLWGLLAMFSLGYLWGIARRRDQWLHSLGRVNVAMGLVVLAAMLLVNSPLLDFRKITVTSQLVRLDSGATTVEDFDIAYFRWQLGKPGHAALQQLKTRYGDTHPALVVRIDSLYRDLQQTGPAVDRASFLAAIEVLRGEMPESLGEAIYQSVAGNPWLTEQIQSYRLLPVDLDRNGEEDYLLFEQGPRFNRATLYYREGDGWQSTGMSIRDADPNIRDTTLPEHIDPNDVRLAPPRWNHLWIGEYELAVEPRQPALLAAPRASPR